jgi:hypothetical protein
MKFRDLLTHCSDRAWNPADTLQLLTELDSPASELAEFIDGILPEEWVASQLSMWHSPHVHPVNWLLAQVGECRIVLNRFQRRRFETLRRSGTVGVHGHQFDFATRILYGGYSQFVYDKCDADGAPARLRGAHKCGAGCAYVFPYEYMHVVLAPEDGTLTLMVQGPVRTAAVRPASVERTRKHLLAARLSLSRALRQVPPCAATITMV